MPTKKSNLTTTASIASIIGIPLAILLWFYSGEATPDGTSSTIMHSEGDASPVLNAGRDAALNVSPRASHSTVPPTGVTAENATPNSNGDINLQSKGDNSPVVNAGRDAIFNVAPPKPDFVTEQDGAGAVLMTDPDFRAFIAGAIDGTGDKVIGRLVNGTSLSLIEQKEASVDEPSPPWARVRVLDGAYKGKEGWILLSSIRKPQ